MRLLLSTLVLPAALLSCAAPTGEDQRGERAAAADAVATVAPAATAVAEPASTEEPDVTSAPTPRTSAHGPRPWFDPAFEPPTTLDTERVRLEPLAARHAELDFAALMGSREHLLTTLGWGGWPRADFTLEENRADLVRHWTEFERREGYAFTVLAPDGQRCLGCVYLEPLDKDDHQSRAALMAYWVIEEQITTGLDQHLLQSMLTWIEQDWPFEQVIVLVHDDNPRGAALAGASGLLPADEPAPPFHQLYAWER